MQSESLQANAALPRLRKDVRSIARAEALSEGDARRAVIEALLVEDFGPEVVNDPRFQEIVDQVRETIGQDDTGRELLDDVLKKLARKE